MLVEFLWDGYFDAITKQLFYPFLLYIATFAIYVTHMYEEQTNEFTLAFCFKMACMVIMGRMFLIFAILEFIQISREGLAYFSDFWNLIDFASFTLNATYVGLDLTRGAESENVVNLIGSVAISVMWLKAFYWMRIFMPFAAFIRMVEEMLKRI